MNGKLWVINHYATDMFKNRGGRHYWFAKNMIANGYETTVFCANTYHNKVGNIEVNNKKYAIKHQDNIPFVFVKTSEATSNGFRRIKNMFTFYKNLFTVANHYKKNKEIPNVILASSVHPLTMVAGIKIAKKYNIPCICEIRDLWPEAIFTFTKINEKKILGKILLAGEYWIYKKADALIFTKEGDVDYLKERKWDIDNGGKINLNKCYYINNGVDIEDFNNSITNNTIDDMDLKLSKFNVIYVGAIRPVNNVGKILDAAKLLKDDPDIQFLIYGDGNEKDYLMQRIKDENLTNVKFKGQVNKRLIPYILSKSSVNLLNYSNEKYNWSRGNSSNKLFEYMASGKPIISTVKMGYSIINKYNCGIELENDSAKQLSDAIVKIKKMPNRDYKIMGENATKGAEDFDFNKLTKKLIQVYKDVLKK